MSSSMSPTSSSLLDQHNVVFNKQEQNMPQLIHSEASHLTNNGEDLSHNNLSSYPNTSSNIAPENQHLSYGPASTDGLAQQIAFPTGDMDTSNNGISLSESKASSAKSDSGSSTGSPRWSANKLISPKKAKRNYDALEKPADGVAATNEDATGPTFGQADMLAKQFGVREREYVPHKRQKSDDEQQNGKAKAKFSGGGSHGPLGEEIKRLRDEGAVEAGPPAPIDLTAEDDDDDDDIQFVKATGPDPQREVCMGTIPATVMADRIPYVSNKLANKHKAITWPASKISFRPQLGNGIVIEVLDSQEQPFGKLDFRVSGALAPPLKASHMSKIRLRGILLERPREQGEAPGIPASKSMPCSITIYASAQQVSSIGKYLSQRQVFLSKPMIVEQGKEVINPHVPTYKGPAKVSNGSSQRQVQMGYKERTTEEIKQDVLGMFDRLINTEELPTMEADTSVVSTELMAHQKQALHFLTQQETPAAADQAPSNLWKPSFRKDGTKIFYNVITGDELKFIDLTLGGIFADMMGLGKTLSTMSRICASLKEARAFGDSELPSELEDHGTAVRNAKGTLLVCPKSVLSNWDEQIKAHLNAEKISFYVYHGPKRTQDIDELAEYDIVITAYSTVGSEFTSSSGNYSAIGKLNWFRVVLDEAHMIRNQTTNVFKAACAILSKRRWAVTGTPIQNRLDDLGALIKFLKVFPFHKKGSFEQHFLAPFKSGDPQVVSNLHLLVGSMTLRRGKEKIDLPDRVESLVRLEFSESESALYQAFAKDSNRKLNAMIGSGGLKGRSYAHVLVNITRLRLVCAHGKELLSEDDMKLLAGSSWDTAIDLGAAEEEQNTTMTEEQVYDTFYLLRESGMDVCGLCNDTIGKTTEGEADIYDDETVNDVIGYMTPCLHAICPRCINDYRTQLAETLTKDNYFICPTCEQYNRAVLPEIRQTGVQADIERRQVKKLQPTKKGGHYGGPHTKVKALLTDLLRFKEESEPLLEIGEPPIRSVIFSGWTQYLDLIEIALNDNNITYLRLDGKMSVAQRSRVLEQFKTDPAISCILVSIKAGGQGLNFTAANKVFMMEPQFNPGVEMQAVDRVHRLGQKRDVEIKRFIMHGSFEEKIVELQRKKVELAQLAQSGGKGSKGVESLKEKMESLRSLFR